MIQRGKRLTAVLAALLLLVSPFFTRPTGAQTTDQAPGQSALSVSPAIIDNSLDPGVSFESEIALANQTASPVAVRASARELSPDQDVDPNQKAAFDASAWFEVETPDFILLAQERKVVKVKVSVPQNAEPGGHYATINFDSFVPEQQNQAGATSVNARVGVVVLLSVSGDIKERISMDGPIKTQAWQTEALPTTFTMTLKNEGNVHVVPTGNLVIRDVFGRKVKDLPLPMGTLLPGTKRDYQVTWERGLIGGVYNVEPDVRSGTNQAKLSSATTRFVIAPLVVIVPIVLILMLAPLVVFLVKRRRRKHRETLDKAAHLRAETASVSDERQAPNIPES